jgi:hypothetical protein
VEIVSDISYRLSHLHNFRTSFCFCVSGCGPLFYRVGLFDCDISHVAEVYATAFALEHVPPQVEPIVCYTDVDGLPEKYSDFLAGKKVRKAFIPVLERLKKACERHVDVSLKFWHLSERDDRYHACHQMATITRKHGSRVRFEYYRQNLSVQINCAWLEPNEALCGR